jgi:hypothetical protein
MAEERSRPEVHATLYQAGQEAESREASEIARPEVHTSLRPIGEVAKGGDRAMPTPPHEVHATLRPAAPSGGNQ